MDTVTIIRTDEWPQRTNSMRHAMQPFTGLRNPPRQGSGWLEDNHNDALEADHGRRRGLAKQHDGHVNPARSATMLSIAGAAILVFYSSIAAACAIEPSLAGLSTAEAAVKVSSDFHLPCKLKGDWLVCHDDTLPAISIKFSTGSMTELILIGHRSTESNKHSVFSIAEKIFSVLVETKFTGTRTGRIDLFDPDHREDMDPADPSCSLSRKHVNDQVTFVFVTIPKI
jgi:hypothetical protein